LPSRCAAFRAAANTISCNQQTVWLSFAFPPCDNAQRAVHPHFTQALKGLGAI
jgi:hypothetical protein